MWVKNSPTKLAMQTISISKIMMVLHQYHAM